MTNSNLTPLQIATRAYLEVALWSSTYTPEGGDSNTGSDDIGMNADFEVSDIAPITRLQAARDVKVMMAVADNLYELADLDNLPDEYEFQAILGYMEDPDVRASNLGHDLWLTRNGHGTGFWDRGLGVLGAALTEVAEAMGPVDLYVGDDGKVYGE